jgi:hypothetical protein
MAPACPCFQEGCGAGTASRGEPLKGHVCNQVLAANLVTCATVCIRSVGSRAAVVALCQPNTPCGVPHASAGMLLKDCALIQSWCL